MLRFRRRFPKDVAEALGEGFLQVHIRNTSGLPFHREYQAILSEFDRLVSETREREIGNDKRSPIERWHEALLKREALIDQTMGLEDDREFAARLIADGLSQRADTDPLLVKALANPFSSLPWPAEETLAVAKKLPLPDKIVVAVERRLSGGRTAELPAMWSILKGTGMRLGEVAGLVATDVVMTHATPHVLVRP
ncbi:MAG: hypothetical protein AAFP85_07930, partial [Pseudomonadota bacterium]